MTDEQLKDINIRAVRIAEAAMQVMGEDARARALHEKAHLVTGLAQINAIVLVSDAKEKEDRG